MKLVCKYICLSFLISFGIIPSGQAQESPSGYLWGTKLMSVAEVESLRPQMIEGICQHFSNELKTSVKNRETHWHRNYTSSADYIKSVASNRTRIKKITGVVDERKATHELILNKSTTLEALIAKTDAYNVYSVSWQVLENVTGTGLWIEPHTTVQAQIVVVPDADQSPEELMGLNPEVPSKALFARRLAEKGCRLIIPLLIDRKDTWSGNPEIVMTNQPHREFIYRRAFEVGRHIIGYEVQKVLAAVDWFKNQSADLPVAVAGYGEGGLIALYSAAIDTRIDGTLVSGYFQEREQIWEEPIYRNVWGLLEEFGDAEIASLIAPRLLVIEACEGPQVDGPPAAKGKRRNVAAPGFLKTPSLESVQAEARRAEKVFINLGVPEKMQVVVSGNGKGLPGSKSALEKLFSGLGIENKESPAYNKITKLRHDFDSGLRMRNQFMELVRHLDKVINHSSDERKKFWDKADDTSVEQWVETTKPYRKYFHEEIIGKMPSPTQSFNPRTRLTYETPNWRGYWVKLDVWPGIIAGGILLVPKDIQPGEKRPVVVFQHGLGGRPEPLIDPNIKSAYYSFGSTLADQGYIVYTPQDPYGIENFRTIQRMANPLKKSLYSVIIGQHEQTLKWLRQLQFVDKEHFGFYGLSYGGKTAMRVPPILNNYSVVICSGDFNQWIWKTTSVDFKSSYMLVGEYEIFEFDFGNIINYSELAGLIAPKPFMVERGHMDGVAPDEWVAYEYAKVRRLYANLGISDRTTIEFFNGPHEIHGVGTLQFLDKYLKLK
ncbi:hypothetical protein D1164_00855 [Mariniphaga sediminis]|uniref:Dienelactone hydrolase domain-containing protein n=1 Tax=Mariniphaga sediminis TaxID=1628158 RepID=A0A399D537_9BACT|nr:hypothetical protein [Mariniphaga sediminis]RIH67015.1 hypothetical protein D1164_00855 [Mariniphaga sediminis]